MPWTKGTEPQLAAESNWLLMFLRGCFNNPRDSCRLVEQCPLHPNLSTWWVYFYLLSITSLNFLTSIMLQNSQQFRRTFRRIKREHNRTYKFNKVPFGGLIFLGGRIGSLHYNEISHTVYSQLLRKNMSIGQKLGWFGSDLCPIWINEIL